MKEQLQFDFTKPEPNPTPNNSLPDRHKAAFLALAAQHDIAKVLSETSRVLRPDLTQHLVDALASIEKIADYLSPDAG